jgi:hypothetical protein
MQRKYEEADVVAVVKVLAVDSSPDPVIFGSHDLMGAADPEWEEIWKGRQILDNLEPEKRWIGLIAPMVNRRLEIKKDRRYLVFLQKYRERLIPIEGSPVGFYEIGDDDKNTLNPLGHADYITERQLVIACNQ